MSERETITEEIGEDTPPPAVEAQDAPADEAVEADAAEAPEAPDASDDAEAEDEAEDEAADEVEAASDDAEDADDAADDDQVDEELEDADEAEEGDADPEAAEALEGEGDDDSLDDDDDDDADGEGGEATDEIADWMVDAAEAIIFCAREPVNISVIKDHFKKAGDRVDADQVRKIFAALKARWDERPGGFHLVTMANGWMFQTHPDSARFVKPMFADKPQRLSRAALETLAIVAYRQPITRPQIDEVRGVDSSGAVKNLLDKQLIRVLGKSEEVGRPLLYGTTKVFLQFFGLQNLRDLPTLKEFRELSGDEIFQELPEEARTEENRAVVMDLFDPNAGELISEEVAAESQDALEALENALGEAARIARGEKPSMPRDTEEADEDPSDEEAEAGDPTEADAPLERDEASDEEGPAPDSELAEAEETLAEVLSHEEHDQLDDEAGLEELAHDVEDLESIADELDHAAEDLEHAAEEIDHELEEADKARELPEEPADEGPSDEEGEAAIADEPEVVYDEELPEDRDPEGGDA